MTITVEVQRLFCFHCKTQPRKKHGISKKGFQQYSFYCSGCEKGLYNQTNKRGFESYKSKIKINCEHCGFVPTDTCQLDIDHIDGNTLNTKEENLQTLCANCHRLKTFKPHLFRQK